MRRLQTISVIKNAGIVLVTAFAIFISTRPLIDAPVGDLVMDGLITGVVSCLLIFLLRHIVRYANYESMSKTQQAVNYSFLGIAFVLFWVGGGFYLTYLLLPTEREFEFLPFIPVRIVMAFMVYTLSVLFLLKEVDKQRDIIEDAIEEEQDESEKAGEISKPIEHIAVKNGQKIDLVYVSDIICILAEGDYVMIYSLNGKYLKEQTMKSLENGLPRNKFVRVHRSSIVNVDHIQRIELFDKQSQMLFLQKGLQVKMSTSGYKTLKEVLHL